MADKAYWEAKHLKYTDADWIHKPSIFAQWAVAYFPSSGSVLDLGAGQAQDSRYFDEKGYKVTATDFSENALRIAKEKSSTSITFQSVDLSQPLPFADQTFDVVYAHLSLHYFDRLTTEKLFQEIHRVLKSRGILAALFNSTNDPEILEGKEIESDFIEIESISKRFFSPQSAQTFAKDFEVIIADNQGTTYKDRAKNVNNLIRLVAKKTN